MSVLVPAKVLHERIFVLVRYAIFLIDPPLCGPGTLTRLMVERGLLTKWLLNRSPELIFVDVSSVFQAGGGCNGPGSDFGRKLAQIRPKLEYMYIYMIIRIYIYV